MRRITWAQACARRLHRHHLLDRSETTSLTAVARDTCGVHAQVHAAAEVALANRVDGLTRQDVAAALWEKRTLVRIPSIRGTVHLLVAGDAPTWLAAARASSDDRAEARRLASLGITSSDQADILAAIRASLDGRALTLRELGEAVAARLGDWVRVGGVSAFGGDWPRWRAALSPAGRAGIVCYGPRRGRELTYVRPDQWLAGWREVEPQAALVQAARWYLRAFGPATPGDLARWLAIRPATAARALTMLGDEVERVDLDGERRLVLAADWREEPGPGSCARLLAHFDPYLLGSHPRGRIFAAFVERDLPVGGGGNIPALLIDGEVGGVWRRTVRGRRAEVVIEAFRPLSRGHRAELELEVERLTRLTGLETSLRHSAVDARPHL